MSLIPMLAVLDLSVNNLIVALLVLVIAIILFVALWKLVAPYLGQFANLVMALVIIIVLLVIAHIFGIV